MGVGVSVEDVLVLVRALPEAEVRDSGTYMNLRVHGKGFGFLSEDSLIVLLKATREEQAALVAADPVAFAPSYESGRFGWIEVRLPAVDPDELAELVTEAWRLTAPKRLAAAHDERI
jgi:hypothetical protein